MNIIAVNLVHHSVSYPRSQSGLIRQNWSQSLNVGSVSIAATLCILFIALIMYLRVQERINGLVKCVQSIQNDLKKIRKQRIRPHRQQAVAQNIEERI